MLYVPVYDRVKSTAWLILLATTMPWLRAYASVVLRNWLTSPRERVHVAPVFRLTMPIKAGSGRLNDTNEFAFHSRTTLAGVTSCTSRRSGTPCTIVSSVAVHVAFPIASSVFCSDINRNMLR